jgi:hypothetical protein
MQASLQIMRDQLASELVKVGTVNFISRSFTKNWLKTEGRNAQIIFFVDDRSLLERIHDSSYSYLESVSFDGKLKAAGHDSREEALMVHSFEIELPAMFGTKESTSGVTRDGRALLGVHTLKGMGLRWWTQRCEVLSRQQPPEDRLHEGQNRNAPRRRGE